MCSSHCLGKACNYSRISSLHFAVGKMQTPSPYTQITHLTQIEFQQQQRFRAGTGAQPLQDLNFSGRGNPPVVALPL